MEEIENVPAITSKYKVKQSNKNFKNFQKCIAVIDFI